MQLSGRGNGPIDALVHSLALPIDVLSYEDAPRPIPGDGEVVEGVASVNEAAITGESAPVIREALRPYLAKIRTAG